MLWCADLLCCVSSTINPITTLSMIIIIIVLTEKTNRTVTGEETISRILFFDDNSMDEFFVYELDRFERGLSLTVCCFNNNYDIHDSNSCDGDGDGNDGVAMDVSSPASPLSPIINDGNTIDNKKIEVCF